MSACVEAGCGQPKGRGRPRRGWVRVEGDFPDGEHGPRWYCSWDCVYLVAVQMIRAESPTVMTLEALHG